MSFRPAANGKPKMKQATLFEMGRKKPKAQEGGASPEGQQAAPQHAQQAAQQAQQQEEMIDLVD